MNRCSERRPLWRRRGVVATIAAIASGLVASPALAVNAQSADQFIQVIGDQTVSILRDNGLSQQSKLVALKDLLDQSTDLNLIGRLVMGQHWRRASPEQQRAFVELFDKLVMRTMAERMSRYRGQTFQIIGSSPIDERDTKVSTRLSLPGEEPFQVDWRVRKSDRGFLLIDIVVEGISLVVTQRSEVNEVVGKQGIDGLLAEMQGRVNGKGDGAWPTATVSSPPA